MRGRASLGVAGGRGVAGGGGRGVRAWGSCGWPGFTPLACASPRSGGAARPAPRASGAARCPRRPRPAPGARSPVDTTTFTLIIIMAS